MLRRLIWEPDFDMGKCDDGDEKGERKFLRIDSVPKMVHFSEDRKQRGLFWTKVIDEVRRRKASNRPPQLHDNTRIDM